MTAPKIEVQTTRRGWRTKPVLSPAEVADLVTDGMTVFVGGSGGGIQEPTALLRAIGARFEEASEPRDLRIWHCSGVGSKDGTGLSLIAREGLIRSVVGGHWGMSPEMARLAQDGAIEAYNLPQGVIAHVLREAAGKRPGLVTGVGVGTFVDPRLEGGRLNARTTQDIVEVVELAGQQLLFYRAPKIDVALIRATTADELGNLAFGEEAALLEAFSAAQAVKANGGRVYVQVKYLVESGSMLPHEVRVPGALVDAIVLDPEQHQTSHRRYAPSLSGRSRVPIGSLPALPPGPRRVVARRASVEIQPGWVVNLGVGMPDGIAQVAAETGSTDQIAFAVEQGHIGGSPVGGIEFGAVHNAAVTLEAPHQFDFFDGGGLDIAFLGMVEVDREGNVNASKHKGTITGAGGFINISQGTRNVVFCGSFTAVGSDVRVEPGGLRIDKEGAVRKFVGAVHQVTFSGRRALELGQRVLYVTERAVFELREAGLTLVEVAPGIDLQRDVLDQMEFEPLIDGPHLMPADCFH